MTGQQGVADVAEQYAALTDHAGLAPLSAMAQIELTGTDRVALLNGLCTNDLRGLRPGAGCEAFLTDARGHIVALVSIFCGPQTLILVALGAAPDTIVGHLEHFLIREDVQIHDQTDSWSALVLAGKDAPAILRAVTKTALPTALYDHLPADLGGAAIWLRRVDWTGSTGWLIQCAAGDRAAVTTALVAAGATRCDDRGFQTTRIEAGTPVNGADIARDNLPQEVGRDERAISFTKGCYLGQETIARIASRGHVNRQLVVVQFAGADMPDTGTPLSAGATPAGRVTSVAMSPRLGHPLALAYVRSAYAQPATPLTWRGGTAVVARLPIT